MLYMFLDCELDTELFALCRDGQTVALRPKGYRLLLYLLENRHRVVPKQALSEAVWPGRFISDATVESTIMAVRQALGDTARTHRFIQTLPCHGYRFVAEVAEKAIARTQPDSLETPATPSALTFQIRFPRDEKTHEPHPEPAVPPGGSHAEPSASGCIFRQVTVLYCDFREMCGSEWPDPKYLGNALERLLDVCSAAVWRFEGHRAQVLADGFWVYYGYPRSQKDAARRAVLSGLGIGKAVARIKDDFRHRYGTEPKVRIGIHTGHAFVAGLAAPDPLVFGPVPIVATRLLGLAEAGAVVISQDTLRLAGRTVLCKEIGTVSEGNSSEPIRAYRVQRAFHKPDPG